MRKYRPDDERIILKCMLRKKNVRVWAALMYLRTVSGGEVL
jgi:RNase P/RNase MRP subunit POP5